MKTLKLLFTLTAVAIVAIASAVENPKMSVTPITADRAVVSVLNSKPAIFEMSVKAQNGDIVYYKQSRKALTSYKKIFDFQYLENGIYSMILKINDTELTRTLEVTPGKINIGESKLTFDPHFVFDGTVLKFSYLNYEKENFILNIYNDQDLIYKTKLGKDFAISSGFDLSKLENGKYKVILSSLNKEYEYSLVK